MKTIFSTIFAAALSLFVTIAAAQAPGAATTTEITPEMRKASARLAAAHEVEKFWPVMIDALEPMATQTVLDAASTALQEHPKLTQEQRARINPIIEELGPLIAADVTAHLRSIDAGKMMEQLIENVYPKYFTQAEIEGLTAYYTTSAYRKIAANDLAMSIDAEKTGDAPAVVKARHDPGHTAAEKQVVADFNKSPLGVKQQQLGAQIGADTQNFMGRYVMGGVDAIIKKYGALVAKRLEVPATK